MTRRATSLDGFCSADEARCSASRKALQVNAAPGDREQRIDRIGHDLVSTTPARPRLVVDQR